MAAGAHNVKIPSQSCEKRLTALLNGRERFPLWQARYCHSGRITGESIFSSVVEWSKGLEICLANWIALHLFWVTLHPYFTAVRNKENAGQVGQNGRQAKRSEAQAEQFDREGISPDLHEREVGSIQRVICPYCDGENILRNGSGSHKSKGREIACQHCQCLLTPSEIKVRTVGSQADLSGRNIDEAA
jgi:hypothetical protein